MSLNRHSGENRAHKSKLLLLLATAQVTWGFLTGSPETPSSLQSIHGHTQNPSYCFASSSVNIYRCAGTDICTSTYHNCDFLDPICTSATKPFLCPNLATAKCVTTMSDCCPASQSFCPHLGTCVSDKASCCSLNPETPIFCKLTSECVSHAYQCCSNYLTDGKQMVKCSNESKCVPENTSDYCFKPIVKDCPTEFPFFCYNDGTCKRVREECPSPVVCPPGYFQCPDRSCVAGLDQMAKCLPLKSCLKALPGDSSIKINFGRCPDGKTCTENFETCPTTKSCLEGILCPDGSCRKTAFECVEPPVQISYERTTSCGKNLLKCPNGLCASRCDELPGKDCLEEKKAYCGESNKCVSNYRECDEPTYCMLLSNYTYVPDTFICGTGPHTCVNDAKYCTQSGLASKQGLYDLTRETNTLAIPKLGPDLYTCTDGRVAINAQSCSTPFACSTPFVKCNGFGEVCLTKTTLAKSLGETFLKSWGNVCMPGHVQCLDGQCRASVYDCPQEVTCPTEFPFQCQDGSCVDWIEDCFKADTEILTKMINCLNKGMIFCKSDLITCTKSPNSCPTIASCPPGYIKCSETSCINPLESQCPSLLGNPCTGSKPFFCRFTQSCAASYDECAFAKVCPSDTPVMCAVEQKCKASYKQCLTPEQHQALQTTQAISTIQLNIMDGTKTTIQDAPVRSAKYNCDDTKFVCPSGCSTEVCKEWTACEDGFVQCWNGHCAPTEEMCPSKETGCPFYAPVRCPYSAECVTSTSRCKYSSEAAAKAQLESICQTISTTRRIGCRLEGNCKEALSQCKVNFSPTCEGTVFPNNERDLYPSLSSDVCYIPGCPVEYPFKCQDGLCVKDQMYCSAVAPSMEEMQRCNSLSQQTGKNIQIPCGDGSCVSHPSQCPPLYDCKLNLTFKVRCGDGSCRQSIADCPLLTNSCPDDLPYMCENGQCAKDQKHCISNDYGCPDFLPFRCQYTGFCMTTSFHCYSPYQVIDYMSISPPSYAKSLCSREGKIPCFSKNNVFYCASNFGECRSPINGCPVDKPILCDYGTCVNSWTNCNRSTSLSNQVALSITNEDLCPPAAPFRCNFADRLACETLGFTSYSGLRSKSCKNGIQTLEQTYFINSCVSGATPYSCADGSCVSDPSLCRSCQFFCTSMGRCVGSVQDCDTYKQNTLLSELDYTCPSGTPYLCVLNGRCVHQPTLCPYQTQERTQQGLLFDGRCPSNSPIRCISGDCVSKYQDCIDPANYSSPAFHRPIAWRPHKPTSEATSNPCQVICSDGSCRDRQENCPVIKACSDPLKPYRCMNGFCAQDKAACIALYGNATESETPGVPSTLCQEETGYHELLFRCEDGTCRPGLKVGESYVTQCLSFQGCPLSAAFQCPTGQCVKSMEDCMQFAFNCKKKKAGGDYQCADQSCVDSPYKCKQATASVEPIQLRYDLDIYSDQTVNFVFRDSLPIGRLLLKPGCMMVESHTIQIRRAAQPLMFSPVPRNVTYSIINQLNTKMNRYLNNKIQIDKEGLISPEDSLLGPAVYIWNQDTNNQQFVNGTARIEFKLDTWPENLNQEKDVCLATAIEGKWVCHSRDFKLTTDGFISFSITQMGAIFALIVNPDESQLSGGFSLWLSSHALWILFGMAVAILLIVLYCLYAKIFKNQKVNDGLRSDRREPQDKTPEQASRPERQQKKTPKELQERSREIREPKEEKPTPKPKEKLSFQVQADEMDNDEEDEEEVEYQMNDDESGDDYDLLAYHSAEQKEQRAKQAKQLQGRPIRNPPRTRADIYQDTPTGQTQQTEADKALAQDVGPTAPGWNQANTDDSEGEMRLLMPEQTRNPQSITPQKSKQTEQLLERRESHTLDEQWYNLAAEYLNVPDAGYSFITSAVPPQLEGRTPNDYESQEQVEQRGYNLSMDLQETYSVQRQGKKKKTKQYQ